MKQNIILCHVMRHDLQATYEFRNMSATVLPLITAGRFDTLYTVTKVYTPSRHD